MDLRERGSMGESWVRHPWERARASYVGSVLEHWAPTARTVLDVGSGDGFVASSVAASRRPERIVCWDVHYSEEDVGRQQVGATVVDRVRDEPTGTFDTLMLLDVLEHVDDDREFLAGLVERRLAPGGGALLSVPAWPALFSKHDEFLGHYRRYRPEQLVALAERSGLEVQAASGLFHSLLPVRALQLAGSRLRGSEAEPEHSDLRWAGSETSARLVTRVLELEERLSLFAARRRVSLHGLSTWLYARRPV
ncbi:MAG: methyltransferase type 11 [Sandaracinus sp.]|nr:methyltransferase type 11 [Sandaracinus sp.]